MRTTAMAPVAAFEASVEHVGMVRPMLFVSISFVAAATLAALIGDRFRSSQSSQSRSLRSLL